MVRKTKTLAKSFELLGIPSEVAEFILEIGGHLNCYMKWKGVKQFLLHVDYTNYLWFFHEVLPIFKKEKNHETSFNNMMNQMMAKLPTSHHKKAADRVKYINSNLMGKNEDL